MKNILFSFLLVVLIGFVGSAIVLGCNNDTEAKANEDKLIQGASGNIRITGFINLAPDMVGQYLSTLDKKYSYIIIPTRNNYLYYKTVITFEIIQTKTEEEK